MNALKPLVDKALGSIACGLLALLPGCAWVPLKVPPPLPEVVNLPAVAPLPRALAPRGLALVLSGGSARGFAHVGAIKVLEEAGIRPDLVVGSSAGSIAAALYASGLTAAQMEVAAYDADAALVSDADWWRLIRLKSLGVLSGAALHGFVAKHTGGRRIEDTSIPLAVVATDLSGGTAAAFTRGDLAHAVRASCAVPGVFEPANFGGRLYADGGISSPLPVAIARRLGARTVIAIDVVYPPADSPPPSSPLGVLFQTYLVQTHLLKANEAARADLVIAPEMFTTTQFGFDDRARLIAAGEAAARAALPRLRELLAKTSASAP